MKSEWKSRKSKLGLSLIWRSSDDLSDKITMSTGAQPCCQLWVRRQKAVGFWEMLASSMGELGIGGGLGSSRAWDGLVGRAD